MNDLIFPGIFSAYFPILETEWKIIAHQPSASGVYENNKQSTKGEKGQERVNN